MTNLTRLTGNGLAAAALAVGLAMNSRAADQLDFNVPEGNFHDSANWSPAAIPGQNNATYVSGGTAYIDQDVTLTKLGVGVTGSGTIIHTNGAVTVTEHTGSGASFSLSGANSDSETFNYTRNALYHLDGGSVDLADGYCHIGQARNASKTSEGVLRITDGAFTTRHWTAIGRWKDSNGHLLLEDAGTMTTTQEGLNVGEEGNGVLTVRGNGSLAVNGPLTIASGAASGHPGSSGRAYVVDGGRVTAAQIQNAGSGKQNGLFADGGILSPDCAKIASSRNNWITGLSAFNVGSRGVTFDTAGRDARVVQTVAVAEVPERLVAANLVHRWSLNGNLNDSIGGQTATAVGETFTDFASYTLPGGAKGTGYISLGPDILPKDGSGVTLEMWVTQLSEQSYSRIFEIGLDSTSTMSMAWSTGTDINKDRIGMSYNGSGDSNYQHSKTGPYSLGIQYHIAWVFTPPAEAGGAWTLTVYKHDAMTGELLKSYVHTPPAGWSLPTAPQNNCWLGHSTYNDNDPSASYDEVRVWKQALTEEELAASVRLGPDTTFGTPGAIVKTGPGRLGLLAATNAADVVVEDGTLALGTGRASALLHRWTFNDGDLEDKAGGGRNAWIVAPTDPDKMIVTNDTSITLPGGAKGTAGHIELGKDILPNDGSPITIELWATEYESGAWSRVFTFGKADDKNKIMLSWTRNNGAEVDRNRDILVVTVPNGSNSSDYSTNEAYLAPYDIGTEYHIAVVLNYDTSAGKWRVRGYKQDATTGQTLNSETFLVNNASWSPSTLVQDICVLGYSTGNDPDANASYDEVRVWAREFSEAELTLSAQLGPDVVPSYPTGAATAAPICESARVEVQKGAFLDLCGGTHTAASLTGEGTVMGGTFVATEAIRPGNGGASGTLKLKDGATLEGSLVIVPGADGSCGALETDGPLDLSNLDFSVADGTELSVYRKYILATCPPGQTIIPFRSLPGRYAAGITYDTATGRVLCRIGGTVFYVR